MSLAKIKLPASVMDRSWDGNDRLITFYITDHWPVSGRWLNDRLQKFMELPEVVKAWVPAMNPGGTLKLQMTIKPDEEESFMQRITGMSCLHK